VQQDTRQLHRVSAVMAGTRRSSQRSGGGRLPYARLPSYPGNGYSSGGTGPRWSRAAMTRALCGALVVLPWTVLLLLVGLHSWHDHGHTSFIQAGLPGAKQCVGWRETYFCHPFACVAGGWGWLITLRTAVGLRFGQVLCLSRPHARCASND
jgi:hypothetical protein